MTGYLRQKGAAAYLGVSVRYFRCHVNVRPLELPGSGRRPVLVWRPADLDAWVERVSATQSRLASRQPQRARRVS
jgi:hypothetical protein